MTILISFFSFFQFQEKKKIGFYKLLFFIFFISILFYFPHSHPNSPHSHPIPHIPRIPHLDSLHSHPDFLHSHPDYPHSHDSPHSILRFPIPVFTDSLQQKDI